MKIDPTIVPLTWLIEYDEKEREDIIAWFNNKMDILVNDHDFIRYNNHNNYLVDVIHEISNLAFLTITPDLYSPDFELRYYNSIISYDEDIYKLIYCYCLTKFDKTIRQDNELQAIIKHNIHGSYPKFNDMQSHDNRKHNRFHDRYRNW